MTRLLRDQGLPRSTGQLLAAVGWDVVHVSEVGLSRAEDIEILSLARTDNRVCVTLDADFHAYLSTSGAAGPSVVRLRREGLNGAALSNLLLSVWPAIEQVLNEGAMVTITERNVRVRRLPVLDV
ncbi:MAG: DUF5615 family PIN-like protein [Gammaproteobacteria bacterium]